MTGKKSLAGTSLPSPIKKMKLGIISDCIHYKTPDGRVCTENHILLKQLSALAAHFEITTICCPFQEHNPALVTSFYEKKEIRFVPVPQVGGNTFPDKLKLLATFPKWFAAFAKINKASDVVYQRFPNNLNLPGFFYFWLKRKKVFATYTGTWNGYQNEAATYRFQRWILRNLFKGPAWVYADNSEINNKRIHAGFSPSYSLDVWNSAEEKVQQKIRDIQKYGIPILRMISVGTLIDYKNQELIIRACKLLKDKSIPFTLTLVGDGPQREYLRSLVADLGLHDLIIFAGRKNDRELQAIYHQSDLVVQAPVKEGFGKVPVEGFFHGVIPIISNTAMALYITGNQQRGFVFDAGNEINLVNVLKEVRNNINKLPAMIDNGRQFAKTQTLEAWAWEYAQTVKTYFESDTN